MYNYYYLKFTSMESVLFDSLPIYVNIRMNILPILAVAYIKHTDREGAGGWVGSLFTGDYVIRHYCEKLKGGNLLICYFSKP